MLKKTTTFLFILFLILIPGISGAQSLIDRLIGKYSSIETLKGEFVQSNYYKDFDMEKVFKGQFFLKRPEKMLWQYNENLSDTVYVNRDKIILYQPSHNQAFYTTIEKTGLRHSPLLLLFNVNKLKHDFRIDEDKKRRCLFLKPSKDSSIDSITLYMNESFMIERLVIIDKIGNKSDIRFKLIQINIPINENIFTFVPPEGVNIIRQ